MPKQPAASEAKRRKNATATKWDNDNTRKYGLKLNCRTDADLIARLDAADSIQGYIKALIRADIERGSEA